MFDPFRISEELIGRDSPHAHLEMAITGIYRFEGAVSRPSTFGLVMRLCGSSLLGKTSRRLQRSSYGTV